MKLLIVVGTRPQFLKLTPLQKYLEKKNADFLVLHTGQHYDKNMSEDIFKTLEIRNPDYILNNSNLVGIKRLTAMMEFIEEKCLMEQVDKIIVFGDCDSTTAGALVAKNMKLQLIHIEAGMRSYNKKMPEEINRVLTDHISDMLLCSTIDSVEKLRNETITNNVHFVGNLHLELLKLTCEIFDSKNILNENNLKVDKFILLTIHRDYNTNKVQLNKIFEGLKNLSTKVVFPIHPRTKKVIKTENITLPKNIILINPVNYLEMTILERNCKLIITDSGGIQPEAWALGKKCVVMRSETEWIEPLKNNNNIIYDYKTPLNIFINNFLETVVVPVDIDTNVSEKIYKLIYKN